MRRWLEQSFGIRAGEFALVQAFFLFFVGIGMYYTVGATVGDTLFLSSLPQEEIPKVLPWIYIGIAVVGLLVTLLYDYIQRRYSRLTVIVGTQVVMAVSVLLFRLVIHLNLPAIYFALSVWMEVSRPGACTRSSPTICWASSQGRRTVTGTCCALQRTASRALQTRSVMRGKSG